jgi:hypothetical protein
MAAGMIFGIFGLGGLFFLLFRLMVLALPTFVGVSAGLLLAFNTGAGAVGAATVELLSGAATLALDQLHFTWSEVYWLAH